MRAAQRSAHVTRPPDIYIQDTLSAKGRGVFAGRDFATDDLVEVCPVAVCGSKRAGVPLPLRRYLFDWGSLAHVEQSCCLVLGYGSMYNHDNPANLRYEADAPSLAMRFIAVRAIRAGEELTINYNAIEGEHESTVNHWFLAMQVPPLTEGR